MLQKYILLIITILTGFGARSQSNTLVIVSCTGQPFYLTVDDRKINVTPQSILKAFDLTFGWHQIEITSPINGTNLILKDSVLFVNAFKYNNKEFTYALIDDTKTLSLQFKSVSEPSGPTSPPVPDAPKEVAPLVDNSIYGNLYKAKANKPVFFHNYNDLTSTCNINLTEKDINYGVKLLNRCNDEERRLSFVKEIVKNNCYTTAQLLLLLNTFSTELERLDIAKPAYLHVMDKKNIALLYPAFKYETVINNYKSFINDQENLVQQKNMKCILPVEDEKFEVLFSKIKSGGYDNEKIIVAKKELVTVCLSLDQAKNLAQLFTHDREKFECLKCVYPVLTDKEHANTLVLELQFKDTREEFLKFISQQ